MISKFKHLVGRKKLQEKNIHVIIATDFNARLQLLKIRKLEIDSYINKIITNSTVYYVVGSIKNILVL